MLCYHSETVSIVLILSAGMKFILIFFLPLVGTKSNILECNRHIFYSCICSGGNGGGGWIPSTRGSSETQVIVTSGKTGRRAFELRSIDKHQYCADRDFVG